MPKKPPEIQERPFLVRKIGEREETVTIKLTQIEIENKRAEACNLRDQVDAMEDKIRSVKADYKAKQDVLEEQERAARRMASTGRADVDLKIEEWLTRNNEIVRLNAETGEQIGPTRAARASELQEQLFPAESGPPRKPQEPQDDFPGGDPFAGT